MERSIRALRLGAIGGLGLTLTVLVLIRFLGTPRDRDGGELLAAALHDARARAVETGRPHLVKFSGIGEPATLEIRDGDDVTRRTPIPGTTVHVAPEWIRLDPTGHASFPPTYWRIPFSEGGFDPGFHGVRPPVQGDVVFQSPRGYTAVFLNLATGRIDKAYRLADQ